MIDKSVLDVILKTCNNTEIPPNPSKKAVNIILIESFLQTMLDIVLMPLVISKKPLIRGEAKDVSILSILKIGEMQEAQMLRIPLPFKMDMILEKITTKPPIKKIVEVALVMLSANISPKLEKDTVLVVCLLELVHFMKL